MNKKKIGIVTCTGLLAMSLVGCQKKEETNSEPLASPTASTEQEETESTEIANPIVEYESAEELAEKAGFDITSYEEVSEPLSKVGDATVSYQMIGDDVAQIRVDYENGAYVEFRASKTMSGPESLAGVYDAGEGVPTGEEDDAPVKYTLGAMEVITFTKDDVNLSILNVGPENSVADDTVATEAPEDVEEAK